MVGSANVVVGRINIVQNLCNPFPYEGVICSMALSLSVYMLSCVIVVTMNTSRRYFDEFR